MKSSESKVKVSVWAAVKIERGYVSRVKLFASVDSALRAERQWRRKINMDYDDTTVLKVGISAKEFLFGGETIKSARMPAKARHIQGVKS